MFTNFNYGIIFNKLNTPLDASAALPTASHLSIVDKINE